MMFLQVVIFSIFSLTGSAEAFVSQSSSHVTTSSKPSKNVRSILSELSTAINDEYGNHQGSPAINSGPCGRFAQLFYQSWNKRFEQKVSIGFIMSPDSSECYHIVIRLDDQFYFDGGNGIMKRNWILKPYEAGTFIQEMHEYDEQLLDKMSYGLIREYPRCPNYSDQITQSIIDKHLNMLTHPKL
ncbi:MAG: hypothetical protein NXI10_16615 [bacterium]|nr:hypothetical protein [bacterium]